MRVRVYWILLARVNCILFIIIIILLNVLRQPFSFVCTDELRLDTMIVFITEPLGVEVQVVLEVFSAGEAAVKYLI